jgi:hypothetical protein
VIYNFASECILCRYAAGLRFRGGYRIPGKLRHYSGQLRWGPRRTLTPPDP